MAFLKELLSRAALNFEPGGVFALLLLRLDELIFERQADLKGDSALLDAVHSLRIKADLAGKRDNAEVVRAIVEELSNPSTSTARRLAYADERVGVLWRYLAGSHDAVAAERNFFGSQSTARISNRVVWSSPK